MKPTTIADEVKRQEKLERESQNATSTRTPDIQDYQDKVTLTREPDNQDNQDNQDLHESPLGDHKKAVFKDYKKLFNEGKFDTIPEFEFLYLAWEASKD